MVSFSIRFPVILYGVFFYLSLNVFAVMTFVIFDDSLLNYFFCSSLSLLSFPEVAFETPYALLLNTLLLVTFLFVMPLL